MTKPRIGAIALVLMVLGTACGGDDAATTTAAAPTTTAATTTTTAATTTTTAATTTTTAVPDTTTTTVAETTTTTEPGAPPSIMLDDPTLGVEPPGVSYRAHLVFAMRPEGGGEGILEVDGGKLVDPEMHSLVVAVTGPIDIPNCFDLSANPAYVSPYDTFAGGPSGEDGDLVGEAFLLEAGLMTNGVLVDRYEITLDNVAPGVADEYVSLDEAYMDVARDGGYLVRLALTGAGRNNTFGFDQAEPQPIEYQLDFSDFGELTELPVPAGC